MTTLDEPQPTHGFTNLGQAVHKRTVDHLPARTAYERFNKRLALVITQNVGTMTCFWLFCVISPSSLLAVVYAAHIIGTETSLRVASSISSSDMQPERQASPHGVALGALLAGAEVAGVMAATRAFQP